MSGRYISFKDIERVRSNINLPAFDRIRVVIGVSDRKLRVDLECVSCVELLRYVSKWWVCPSCNQEVTDQECADLVHFCYERFKEVFDTYKIPDDGTSKDDRRGILRWVRELMSS